MHLYQILKLFYVINTENFTEKFNRQSKLGFDGGQGILDAFCSILLI
ncbi:hypothetical protein K4Q46_06810 [Staphylococcus epidermidis]|nr:hypothetical protein [Staphylococcus epidermidis]